MYFLSLPWYVWVCEPIWKVLYGYGHLGIGIIIITLILLLIFEDSVLFFNFHFREKKHLITNNQGENCLNWMPFSLDCLWKLENIGLLFFSLQNTKIGNLLFLENIMKYHEKKYTDILVLRITIEI